MLDIMISDKWFSIDMSLYTVMLFYVRLSHHVQQAWTGGPYFVQ